MVNNFKRKNANFLSHNKINQILTSRFYEKLYIRVPDTTSIKQVDLRFYPDCEQLVTHYKILNEYNDYLAVQLDLLNLEVLQEDSSFVINFYQKELDILKELFYKCSKIGHINEKIDNYDKAFCFLLGISRTQFNLDIYPGFINSIVKLTLNEDILTKISAVNN